MNGIEQAITSAGGMAALARSLNLSGYQVVQSWLANGNVPAEYCAEVERLYGISRSRLNRKWRRLWPELVAHEGCQ